MRIIITSPSLDPTTNVSGLSAVTRFIIENNPHQDYVHFELGRKDGEKGGIHRVNSVIRRFKDWKRLLKTYPDAIVHYNFPLDKLGITRHTVYACGTPEWEQNGHTHSWWGLSYIRKHPIPFPADVELCVFLACAFHHTE